MDSIFIRRMREDHRWYLKMSLIYGAVFTFCLYENMSGITFPAAVVSALVFAVLFLKKMGIAFEKGTVRYFVGITLLGISTAMTDSGFFHFFNCIGIVLLYMMAMAHQMYNDQEWGFAEYVKKFFIMVWTWIISVGEIFRGTGKDKARGAADACADPVDKEGKDTGRRKKKNLAPILLGILAAALMLIVVMPLLMMSDKIFSQIFSDLFKFLDPFRFLRQIDFGNIIGVTVTFLFGMVSLYAFFAGLFRMNLGEKGAVKTGTANFVTGITFTGIMAGVYVLYSGIQILFLFMRLDTGLPGGVTYSQYAHEGFWQLLFVSIINFVTVLVCARIFTENRVLKIMLTAISVCTCVMTVSAAYRMMLYVSVYHLTFLRVLVLWFLGVLTVIFAGVIYSIYRKEFRLFRYITAAVSVCYILFSLSRPDYLIAEYNISHTEEMNMDDIAYLTYGLSEDAAPAVAGIVCEEEEEDMWKRSYLDDYFQNILDVHEDEGIRNYNFSRAEAKRTAEEWLREPNTPMQASGY